MIIHYSVNSVSLHYVHFLQLPVTSSLVDVKCFLSNVFSKNLIIWKSQDRHCRATTDYATDLSLEIPHLPA
jgi:hypothetical protein